MNVRTLKKKTRKVHLTKMSKRDHNDTLYTGP